MHQFKDPTAETAAETRFKSTVPLSTCKSKLFINGSCPILVLKMVTYVWVARVTLMLKTVFKIIRGQQLPEKMRFENRTAYPDTAVREVYTRL
jgi:hypothetical protein